MSVLQKVLHKAKSKSPHELVTKTNLDLQKVAHDGPSERLIEELGKFLVSIKVVMFGEGDTEPSKDNALLLAYEACKTDTPLLLVQNLHELGFESRKDAAQVCGAIVRMDSAGDMPGVTYVHNNPHFLVALFKGYDNPDIALNCGSVLRDCTRDESIARMVLEGPLLPQFFDKVQVQNFEVASDAFATFKDLLTRHKDLVAKFLDQNYDEFFSMYRKLLESENYFTRRQATKLLGEVLLDRPNNKVMKRYVDEPENLKLMMMMLKDSSRSIQFEAFHVFKVFVANPAKTRAIVDILVGNKEKLLKYLADFHAEKDDEQFREEKATIIREISLLRSESATPTAQPSPNA